MIFLLTGKYKILLISLLYPYHILYNENVGKEFPAFQIVRCISFLFFRIMLRNFMLDLGYSVKLIQLRDILFSVLY